MERDLNSRREEEWRPLREAGQGEQEGFEEAEDLMRENAEHGEHTTALDGLGEEAESDLSGAEYGEADEYEESDQ
jgi:hypothetical protein